MARSASTSAVLLSKAASKKALACAWKSSLRATKSVSQLISMATAFLASSLIRVRIKPSLASLSALLSATFWPFFLRISTAVSKSPLASLSAFFAVHHACTGHVSEFLYVCSRNAHWYVSRILVIN
jgi:hypothetical protein